MATSPVPIPVKHRRIQQRRDLAAQWLVNNPVLLDGEFGIEKDTRLFKIGDGVTPWATLPYGGLRGADGGNGFISADADNRLRYGTDGGLYVPELTTDLAAIYNTAKT